MTRGSLTLRERPQSVAEQWAAMGEGARNAFIDSLSESEAEAFLYEWEIFARPEQLPPDDAPWFGYLALAGRGWGKTRSGAEWIRKRVAQGFRYIALVGETAADVRDVMIEGESGLLAISPPGERPKYEPSKRRLVWPNGAMAICYSGKEPDQLRGPQHDTAWADEPAKWQYAQEAWDNLEMGLRLGAKPQVFITTTPRPIPIIKAWLADPMIRVVTGSSYDNIANLAETFIQRVLQRYEGTRLGEQELHARVLGDVPNALWTQTLIDERRYLGTLPPMKRTVVGVDPAMKQRKAKTARQHLEEMTKENRPNETGIVVVSKGMDGRVYVREDLSGEYSPKQWGDLAVDAYQTFKATRMVAERNQGGELVELNVRAACDAKNLPMINYRSVFASIGKGARAEPIAGDTARGKVWFAGQFGRLEDQLTSLTPDEYLGVGSPDRADAFVHAATELIYGRRTSTDPGAYAGSRR